MGDPVSALVGDALKEGHLTGKVRTWGRIGSVNENENPVVLDVKTPDGRCFNILIKEVEQPVDADLKKLTMFIEAALRHADLPDNPGVESVESIQGESGVVGVELTNGRSFFVEVKPA